VGVDCGVDLWVWSSLDERYVINVARCCHMTWPLPTTVVVVVKEGAKLWFTRCHNEDNNQQATWQHGKLGNKSCRVVLGAFTMQVTNLGWPMHKTKHLQSQLQHHQQQTNHPTPAAVDVATTATTIRRQWTALKVRFISIKSN